MVADNKMDQSLRKIAYKGQTYYRSFVGWHDEGGRRVPDMDYCLKVELRVQENAKFWVGISTHEGTLVFDPDLHQSSDVTVCLWAMERDRFIEIDRSYARSTLLKQDEFSSIYALNAYRASAVVISRMKIESEELPYALKEIKIVSLDLIFTPVDPLIPRPTLAQDDYSLCLWWGNAAGCTNQIDNAVGLDNSLGTYHASRLASARCAELAAFQYYEALGCNVEDVSIKQLQGIDLQWRDFDLLANDQPLDVKNARRSFSSPDQFVEYTTPKFKKTGTTGRDVAIVGVFSDYHASAQELTSNLGGCLVLGSVMASDIANLGDWLAVRFEQTMNFRGIWAPQFQPGWIFEFSEMHYPRRRDAVEKISMLVEKYVKHGAGLENIPGWILSLCTATVLPHAANLPEDRRQILTDLRSLRRRAAIT